MKNNHVTKRKHFIGALAFFVIACICAVLMFSNASFANPNEATEDQAANNAQEITNDANTPTNEGSKYAYIAGSGIGGSIDEDVLDLNSMKSENYDISVVMLEDNVRFRVGFFNEDDHDDPIGEATINLDEYGRFDYIIFYGPAKIDSSTGEIIREIIPITSESESPQYKNFKFSDYAFTYPESSTDLYNYLEFEPIGENYFGGTIAGKGEGHDSIDISISHYVEDTVHPDEC